MTDPGAGSDQGGPIVLLIDEDPRSGRLVRLTLSGTGFQLLACTRHQEGLALLERYRPGLVLMERHFESVDGRELIDGVLQAATSFPCRVVILSDEAPVSERLRLLGAGAVDYVVKTEDLQALGGRLKPMLARVIEGEEPPHPGDPGDIFQLWPDGAQAPPAEHKAPAAPELQAWRERIQSGPLLLVIPQPQLREALQEAAGQRGLAVINAASGRDAFTLAHQYRPLAMIADELLPDISGRDLLASIRCDFVIRETPVVLVSSQQLIAGLASGAEGLAPVLEAMQTALGPRVQALQRFAAGSPSPEPGWVEPVGVANLLRSLGSAGQSGHLLLRHGQHRNAAITFQEGAITAAAVNSPQSSDGPLALLHLLGYEWQEYFFCPAAGPQPGSQPLGELESLVETASRQNNVLLSRLYLEGIRREDQLLNYPAMDLYMSQLNRQSLALFQQLGEGTPAADMAASGEAAAATLKSLLFEMRRRAVIRPNALAQVRMEPVTLEVPPVSEAPPGPGTPPLTARVTGPQLPPGPPVREPRTSATQAPAEPAPAAVPRWLVALLAAAVTLSLAAGGYFLYVKLIAG